MQHVIKPQHMVLFCEQPHAISFSSSFNPFQSFWINNFRIITISRFMLLYSQTQVIYGLRNSEKTNPFNNNQTTMQIHAKIINTPHKHSAK